MKRLLAHVNNKKELTEYLAIKMLEKVPEKGSRVSGGGRHETAAARCRCHCARSHEN